MASPTGQTGLGKFPHQIVIMVSIEVADRIADDAGAYKLSKSQVARAYIDAGIEAADEAVRHEARVARADREKSRAVRGR